MMIRWRRYPVTILLQRQRRFASKSSKDLFSVVPFRVSLDDAVGIVRDFCDRQWLAPETFRHAGKVQHCRKVFTPFWAFDISTTTSITAEVGIVKSEKQHISWTNTRLLHPLRNHYSNDLPEMQVYAGPGIRRANVQVLKVPLSAVSALSSQIIYGQDVEPFSIHRSTAVERVLDHIHSMERHAAERELTRITGASFIRNVNVTTTTDVRSPPRRVYFPAYVFPYEYMDTEFTIVVNGFNGAIMGLPQFSAIKVAIALAGPLTLLLHSISLSISVPVFFGSIVIPAIAIGWGASVLPGIIAAHRERQRIAEQLEGFSFVNGSRRGAYSEHEEHAYDSERWEKRYEKQYSGDHAVGKSTRHLYTVLGVDSSASLEDISRGFRSRALKYHPDVHRNEDDKLRAAEQFKKVVNAYQVLRDPVKRGEYDRTGQV